MRRSNFNGDQTSMIRTAARELIAQTAHIPETSRARVVLLFWIEGMQFKASVIWEAMRELKRAL